MAQDYKQAVAWLQKAAEQGHAQAQTALDGINSLELECFQIQLGNDEIEVHLLSVLGWLCCCCMAVFGTSRRRLVCVGSWQATKSGEPSHVCAMCVFACLFICARARLADVLVIVVHRKHLGS